MLDCIIIGGGISGIIAGNYLKQNSFNVKIIDKGKAIGGRMATRRLFYGEEKVVFDYGAQFFTVRNSDFKNYVDFFKINDLLSEWIMNSPNNNISNLDLEKKYIGKNSIRELAISLSKDLDILTQTRITKLDFQNNNWILSSQNNEVFNSKFLLLTPPLPQSLELIEISNLELDNGIYSKLKEINYDSCITALFVLDGPSNLPESGALRFEDETVLFIADNNKKGISKYETGLTIQMGAKFSQQNWNLSNSEFKLKIEQVVSNWIGSKVIDFQIHKWKYSKPQKTYFKSFEHTNNPGHLFFAGDAFLGGRVESAALSGLYAAQKIVNNLQQY